MFVLGGFFGNRWLQYSWVNYWKSYFQKKIRRNLWKRNNMIRRQEGLIYGERLKEFGCTVWLLLKESMITLYKYLKSIHQEGRICCLSWYKVVELAMKAWCEEKETQTIRETSWLKCLKSRDFFLKK